MSRAISPATGRAYGLARVARVWHLSRATVYRHRGAPDPAALAGPARRGPVGACSDAALLEHIRAQILGSRLHGEGHRKVLCGRPRSATPSLLLSRHRHCSMLSQRAVGQPLRRANRRFAPGV